MGRKSDLTNEQIAAATSLLKFSSLSQREICQKINLSKGSVAKISKSINNNVALSARRKGNCGAKRKTDERCDRIIINTAMKHNNKPIKIVKNMLLDVNIDISTRTIRRRLAEKDIRTYRAIKKPKLNKIQMKKRLAWARAHLKWSTEQWQKVACHKSFFTII